MPRCQNIRGEKSKTGKLDGKVAIITGASRGIGQYIGEEFGKEGARVVCGARTLKEGDHRLKIEGSLESTVAKIKAAGGDAIAVVCDISSGEDCQRLVAETKKAYGPCDILVNNAILLYPTAFMELTPSRWMKSFMVDVHAPFILSQLVLRDMIPRRSGAIINISSAAAIGPGRAPYKGTEGGSTSYGAVKAALERMTQGLAEEMYPHNISVTCLSPSELVATPGNRYMHGKTDANYGEPLDYMGRAAVILATEPVNKVSGWVTYDQVVLKRYGLIREGRGVGIDSPGSGYSQI